MARIRSLRPNVTREAAVQEFSRGVWSSLHAALFGPLRSVADFYIPFRLFEVEILNRGQRDQRIFGLDAVIGALELYHFEQLPGEREVVYCESRNCAEALLDEPRARELLLMKVRRLIFNGGFFRIRDLHINAEPLVGEIHIPYWVGFRGRGAHAHLQVMDAVRRRVEGAKVRQLLEAWLTEAH
jgi:hypothetical protein